MDISTLEIGTVLTQSQMVNIMGVQGRWDGSVDIIVAMDAFAHSKGFKLIEGDDRDIFVKARK